MGQRLGWIRIIASKDLRLFLADRRAVLCCFVVPILLASVFGSIFHRPSQDASAVSLKLWLVAADDRPATHAVIRALERHPRVVARQVDAAHARAAVDRRDGIAIWLWHHGAASPATERLRLEVLHHPLSRLESQWAEGILTEVVLRELASRYLPDLGQAIPRERPFDLIHRTPTATHQSFNAYSHSFSGMTLQYLLFWGMECGLLLLRERQGGIWRRLQSAPPPLWAILFGRAVATGIVALAQVVVTFAFGYLVFGVAVTGSFTGFVFLAGAVSLLAAATGLLVATLSSTEARARSVCILVILTVAMMSGLWLPGFLLPDWVRMIGQSLPTTWAMRGLDGVTWQGQSLIRVLPAVGVVLLFAGGFLLLAAVRFSKLEARRRRGWT